MVEIFLNERGRHVAKVDPDGSCATAAVAISCYGSALLSARVRLELWLWLKDDLDALSSLMSNLQLYCDGEGICISADTYLERLLSRHFAVGQFE